MEESSKTKLLQILQQANNSEGSGELVIPPQYLASVREEETKRQLRRIEKAEAKRADGLAQLIADLSGHPKVRLPKIPFRPTLKEMLELHIRGGKRAVTIYQRALQDCEAELLKTELQRISREATAHLRLLQRLLETL